MYDLVGQRGDVIAYSGVFRNHLGNNPLEHYGIDCGDGTVIEFSGMQGPSLKDKALATIRRVNKNNFINKAYDGKIHVRRFEHEDPVDLVMERAFSALKNGFGSYHILYNNCQHFASWCKTGKKTSPQIRLISNLSEKAFALLGMSHLYQPVKFAAHILS